MSVERNPLIDISNAYIEGVRFKGTQISEKKEGELRFCPKCKKAEYRSECVYGPKYWDSSSTEIPEKKVEEGYDKPDEKLGAVTAIPKSEQDAAKERILAKTKKKREEKVSEGFSDWKHDLSEVITGDEDLDKVVKEKKVKNKIKINPKLGEAVEEMGGQLIEMVEIDEAESNPGQSKMLNNKKLMLRKQFKLDMKKNRLQKQGKLPVGHMEETDIVDEAVDTWNPDTDSDIDKRIRAGIAKKKKDFKTVAKDIDKSKKAGTRTFPANISMKKEEIENRLKGIDEVVDHSEENELWDRVAEDLTRLGEMSGVQFKVAPDDNQSDETQDYVDFLIGEGYDCSELTLDDMHEEYQSLDEGLRSAVKRLLGKKDKPAEKKPESRGEQLRKKYNVGPERSDTSAKAQILKRTRAKKERDQEEYGGSVYSKSVAKKSADAHDRYLRGGYSKYGADDPRGRGNKAAKRAAALRKEELDEMNRYEKETGKDFKTGMPVRNAKSNAAFTSVKRMIRQDTGKPAGQQKKEKGKKAPTSGYFKPQTSVDRLKQRQALAARKPQIGSRFD